MHLLNVQASLGICKLSEVLGESLSSHHSILLTSLMKEIPGRLWEVFTPILKQYLSYNLKDKLVMLANGKCKCLEYDDLKSLVITGYTKHNFLRDNKFKLNLESLFK